MAQQQCLVLIKPDGLIKSLTGNVITAFSETKLKIVGAKVIKAKRELLEKHYSQLKEKKPQIYEETINYMMGKYHTDRIFALVYQGEDAIEKVREICGSTNPEDANPVSIRGKYGRINSKTKVFENVVHASDSKESAEKEIKLWFAPHELTETIYPTKTETIGSEHVVWK
jgi:nucleoside-diphosphate kinase